MRVNGEWRGVLREAFGRARGEYGAGPGLPPVEVLVTLVMMFGQGAQVERLLGIDSGHAELLAWIDGWLEDLHESAR